VYIFTNRGGEKETFLADGAGTFVSDKRIVVSQAPTHTGVKIKSARERALKKAHTASVTPAFNALRHCGHLLWVQGLRTWLQNENETKCRNRIAQIFWSKNVSFNGRFTRAFDFLDHFAHQVRLFFFLRLTRNRGGTWRYNYLTNAITTC
jgi:hypothetical protein